MFTYAIVRKPGENFYQGLTSSDLGEPNFALMLEQHQAYVAALQQLGLTVDILPPLANFPDAYFVEDTAVITPELAIVANPGASLRNGEQHATEPVLAQYRPLARIEPPGTLDGGDVLIIDSRVFMGISERTNVQGAGQLGQLLQPFGYTCVMIPVRAGLHLKSSVSFAGNNTLLLNAVLAAEPAFKSFKKIILAHNEEYAANSLLINDYLIIPRGFSDIRDQVRSLPFTVIELDVSEARKMDGGLSCMSLRF